MNNTKELDDKILKIQSFKVKNGINGIKEGSRFERCSITDLIIRNGKNNISLFDLKFKYKEYKNFIETTYTIDAHGLRNLIKDDKVYNISYIKGGLNDTSQIEENIINIFDTLNNKIETKKKDLKEKEMENIKEINAFEIIKDFKIKNKTFSKGTLFTRFDTIEENGSRKCEFVSLVFDDLNSDAIVDQSITVASFKKNFKKIKHYIHVISYLAEYEEPNTGVVESEEKDYKINNITFEFTDEDYANIWKKLHDNVLEDLKEAKENIDSWKSEYIKAMNEVDFLKNNFKSLVDSFIKKYVDKYDSIDILDELEFDKKEEATVYFNIIEALKELNRAIK